MGTSQNMELNNLILAVRDRDDDAFAELVRRYTPMMNKVISGFTRSKVRIEEAFAESCVRLYRAALSYDVSRTDVTFGLYAQICIYHRMCDLVGKDLTDSAVLADDFDVDMLSVANAIEQSLVGREVMRHSLAKAREILSEYEYKVFVLYLNGYATSEIAKKLGKTAKSVDNAKARLFRHLREASDSFPTAY